MVSKEQAVVFRKHTDAADKQGDLAWAVRVGHKALRVGAEALPHAADIERSFGLSEDEKVLWRILRLARRYTDLEHARVLSTDALRAFLRGLVAADVLDILDVAEAKALIPAEVRREKAALEGKELKAPTGGLKGQVYRPEIDKKPAGGEVAGVVDGGGAYGAPAAAAVASGHAAPAPIDGIPAHVPTPAAAAARPAPAAPAAPPSAPARPAPARPAPTRPVPAPAPAAGAPPAAEAQGYLDKLVAARAAMEKQNHYAFFGVQKTASDADIKAAFVRLAREYHPDKLAGIGLADNAEARACVDALFKRLSEAHSALGSAAARQKYDAELKVREAAPASSGSSGKQRRPVEAKVAFTMAETHFKKRDFASAERHYKQAVAFDPDDPRYAVALAWCIAQNPDVAPTIRQTDAIKRLTEVLATHKHGDAAYKLGRLLRDTGDEVGAQQRFEDALRFDKNHVEAAREVRLVQMRREKAEAERKASDHSAKGLLGKFFRT